MNVMVTSEYRFYGAKDGTVWTPGQFRYSYFTRYLDVFDRVMVAARIRVMDHIPSEWQRADGAGVSFAHVPYYVGPVQFALSAHKVQKAMKQAVLSADAAIFRAPGMMANLAGREMRKQRKPYGVEVVADPSTVFAPGVVDHPLRPLFRAYSSRQLMRHCRAACAAAYLTKEALQKRFPSGPGVFRTSFPEVELGDDAFAPSRVRRDYAQTPFALIAIGSMAQMYKGFDVLFTALKTCLQDGLDLKLVLLGDGKFRGELEALAARLEISDRVFFLGQLPSGPAVRDQLDRAHLFVMPSRTEGMPSAMIEAMARGLPSIGSTAGGIPELLKPENLVPPGDAVALAEKIREVVRDPERLARMSAENLETARPFHERTLRKLRIEFYRYVKEKTEAWQRIHRIKRSA